MLGKRGEAIMQAVVSKKGLDSCVDELSANIDDRMVMQCIVNEKGLSQYEGNLPNRIYDNVLKPGGVSEAGCNSYADDPSGVRAKIDDEKAIAEGMLTKI